MTDNFSDGRYDPDTKETILDALVADAESQQAFGTELDPDELSIIRAHYDPVAERMAELQDDLKIVLDSSQLDHATGTALDLYAAWVGVFRNEATKSTGRVRFSRDSRATQDYVIPEGTVVQTTETDPTEFETDTSYTLGIIDNFEDGDVSDYNGDSANISAITSGPAPVEGTYAMEHNATASSYVSRNDVEFGPGSKIHCRVYLNASTIPLVRFGLSDDNNCYQVRLDDVANSLEIEKVESGTASDIATTSVTIPTGEWLDLEIFWKIGGDIDVDLDDSAGADVATVSGNDTTYTSENGFGFGSEDANATKAFDMYTMSAIGADVTAVEAGVDSNLGVNVLNKLKSPVSGVGSVINPQGTTGGADEEEDDDYRARVKSELADGVRGTQDALTSRLEALDEVTDVDIIENDSDSTDGAGRPAHSFEPVVQVGSSDYDTVAQTIFDTKGIGYPSVGGYGGTGVTGEATRPDGSAKTVNFSVPTEKKVNMDIDLTKDGTYGGDAQVQDNIVRYIGGTLNSGDTEDGELDTGDDVVYYQVVEAIMDTEGVIDITNLEMDFTATPTGTSNLTIAAGEIATVDATDSSLDVTSSDA